MQADTDVGVMLALLQTHTLAARNDSCTQPPGILVPSTRPNSAESSQLLAYIASLEARITAQDANVARLTAERDATEHERRVCMFKINILTLQLDNEKKLRKAAAL